MGQFLGRWLSDSVKPAVRPRTFQSYQELVRLHLGPVLGRIPLAKLQPQNVQALINAKLSTGLSPRRVQYIHAVLRRALGQAQRWDLVQRNVARLVDSPRVERVDIEPYTPDEAKAFVQAIRGDRLEALFHLALAIGLRQGEVLGLSWTDVDFDRGQLSVRASLQRIDGEFRIVEPKSARSRRVIALPEPSLRVLRGHRLRQLEERLFAGPLWEDTGLVFTTPTGAPLSDGHVRKRLYQILRHSGLRRLRFHDLRHACASLLLAQNVHPRVVMETLGHSTFTMDLYAHVIPSLQREAAGKMGQLLDSR